VARSEATPRVKKSLNSYHVLRDEAAGGSAEGPPPGHTGGLGEPTCRACHFDAPEELEVGELVLKGLRAAYAPGTEYPL